MRYFALACDYDGTIAKRGIVDGDCLNALTRLKASGRKLILVTGRELDELLLLFPEFPLFDRIVAENGAVLFRPETREEKLMGKRPPEEFVNALRKKGIAPLSVGRVIVATWQPHETAVLGVIRDIGLELQLIFNKGAVMVLPTGINKATGLKAALAELKLSPHNVVGIGDGENDHAFLEICECSAAVANAVPVLKERVDYVAEGDHCAGVVELIDRLLHSDLQELEPKLERHHLILGTADSGETVFLKPYGENVLLAGTSGSGKSTLATLFLEELIRHGYQASIIDPEGDYTTMEQAIVLGASHIPPNISEVLRLLEDPSQNIVVNMVGIGAHARPSFFEDFFLRLHELRTKTGRPHWIIIDEAHHLLPASRSPAVLVFLQGMSGIMFITVHPEHVAPAAMSLVDVVVTVGESPEETLWAFRETSGLPVPIPGPVKLGPGEALFWPKRTGADPIRFPVPLPTSERRRHRRKYATGELPPERSFYFRGPQEKMNLQVQNLLLFIQMAEGVDDETWMHHLRQGDYSRWFREAIKDEELASRAAEIEARRDLSPRESRDLMKAAIEELYTAPP
jgi:hypothetical protein